MGWPVPFEKALSVALQNPSFDIRRQDEFYLSTYGIYKDYFQSLNIDCPSAERDFQIGVCLVYTWMGRAKLNGGPLSNFSAAKAVLQEIKQDGPTVESLTETRFSIIQEFVGGSLIATSKFLHFLHPETFAIWDRHVARACYGFQHHAQITQYPRYELYQRDIRQFKLPTSVDKKVTRILGDVSELRKKEFAIFMCGVRMLPG